MQTSTPITPVHPLRWSFSALPPGRRRVAIAVLAVVSFFVFAILTAFVYLWHVSRHFPRAPFTQPSRLYASVPQLVPGTPLTAEELIDQLTVEGYREAPADPAGGGRLGRGSWRRYGEHGEGVEVHLRRFPTPGGMAGGVPLEIDLKDGRVARLAVAGRAVGRAVLEPPLLASFYGRTVDERRPVTLDTLPDPVVKAVLAAEDDAFFVHPGISIPSIARALWIDLKGGAVQQGGSTITQQLVKTLYLSRRRTLDRKAREALIAVILELRYSKQEILEAYLNEIYWGRSGPANLIGLGAAARAWFGKDPDELTLAEAATLAGMIRGPSEYSPVDHPDKARERRNWVLGRMATLGWVSPERAARAEATPLDPAPQTVAVRPFAPYFANALEAEAKQRFKIDALADAGYLLFSTLDPLEQRHAETTVTRELDSLEKGVEKRHRGEAPLQAALLSVDPRDGAVRAWVGGRDWSASQFDRVTQARRQAGSAFKPVVYSAAFREAAATPATLLKDSPIVVRVGNAAWQPQNNDHSFRGWVTVRSALEKSLNVPTVRLALQVGLDRVIGMAHAMGIEGELEPVPALALGAFEVTPYEMAQVYATLASGGLHTPLHGLAAVEDRGGEAVLGSDLQEPRRVMPSQTAYVVTSILQGVIDHGTGAGVRGEGLRDPLAGKTGTTNDRRDSWFAGYSPDRVTVVWVGYDDNSSTRLSGARAALPIWSRFMTLVRPAGGYPAFVQPEGMQKVTIDPVTGQLATPLCPYQVTEVLPDWQVPAETCQRHQPGVNDTSFADVNLNGAPIDPATGRPFAETGWDPYGQEDPVSSTQTVTTTTESGGSILIRPARERPPAAPALAVPEAPAIPSPSNTETDDTAATTDQAEETPPP